MPSASVRAPDDRAPPHWTDGEVDGGVFKDARLGKRFRERLIQLGGGMSESIALACQDWANTKAAYRFFSNTGSPSCTGPTTPRPVPRPQPSRAKSVIPDLTGPLLHLAGRIDALQRVLASP